MAKGFGFVQKSAQERKARMGGSSVFAGKQIFKLPSDGDVGVVRFIPDEDGDFIYGARHHEVPREGQAWGDLVPCIAQDEDGNVTDDACPGCENDLKMKDRFFALVLWKEAPVYKTDDKGKIVKDNLGDPVVIGHEDQIAVWPFGPQLAENLEEIDESYELGSREYRVKRKGEGLETTYQILPADVDGGKTKPSQADKKLMANTDIELIDFIKPPSYEDFERRLSGNFSGGGGNGSSSKPAQDAAKKNPFKRKKG